MKKIFFTCLALIGLVGSSFAQEGEAAAMSESVTNQKKTNFAAEKETTIVKLSEAGVDEETSAKVIEIEQEFLEKKLKLQSDASSDEKRAEIMTQLDQQRENDLRKILGDDAYGKYTSESNTSKSIDAKPVKSNQVQSKTKKG